MHQGAVMKIIKNDEAVSPVKTVSTEDAVSPVIGVILMVAITVILAAVIAAFVFGMAGTTTTTKTVGLTVTKATGLPEAIDITFTGGADLSSLNGIRILQNGNVVIPTAPGDFTGPTGVIYTVGTVGATTGDITPSASFKVGEITKVNLTAADVSGTKVTINGLFKDGSTQILYDRTL